MSTEIKPYVWQEPAVEWHKRMLQHSGVRFHLNTSKTGRGKTIHVCAALSELGLPVFVVCPKNVVTDWYNTLVKMECHVLDVKNYEFITWHKTHPFGKWYRKDFMWSLPKKSVVVFDEIHKCTGEVTKATRLLKGVVDNTDLQAIGLSATAADSPMKMKGIGYALGLHTWFDFRTFQYRNGCRPGTFGGVEFPGSKEQKAKVMAQMVEPVRDRIFEVDFPEDFPKNTIMTALVDIKDSTALNAAYMKVLDEKEEEDRKLPITKLLRARQRAEYLKVPAIVEMAKDHLTEGNSIVAFFNFKESREYFVELLKKPCGEIYGGQSDKERQQYIEDFQSNKLKVMAVMIQAGGQSISLHDTDGNHPRISLICPSYSARELIQSLGRIHRATQKSPCINKIIFAARSVETQIRQKVEDKISRIEALNDSDLLTDAEVGRVGAENLNLDKEHMDEEKKVDHSQRGHSKYSPSGLKNKKICPGYLNDNSKPPHPITIEGTMLHEILDGAELPKDGLTREQEEMIDLCEGVKQMCKDEFPEGAGNCEEFNEVTLSYLQGTDYKQQGNMDVLLLGKKHACIIDWKFGYRRVDPAKDNMQGKGYALACMEDHPQIDSVEVVFVQPRCDYLTQYTFTRKDHFDKIRSEILNIVEECEKPDHEKKYKVDEGNCKYCARNGNCPAMCNVAIQVAEKAGMDIPDIDLKNLEDPKNMGALLRIANWMAEWSSGVKSSALRWYKELGVEPEGFSAQKRSGARNINDLVTTYNLVKDVIPLETYLDCCKISVPALEKAFSHNKEGSASATKKELEHLLKEADLLSNGQETVSFRRKD